MQNFFQWCIVAVGFNKIFASSNKYLQYFHYESHQKQYLLGDKAKNDLEKAESALEFLIHLSKTGGEGFKHLEMVDRAEELLKMIEKKKQGGDE